MSNILVVDDMAMCRELLAEALRAHGHCVTCAGGGTEAIELLKAQRPDVVLLDVTMPEPDGLTVLRMIRRDADLSTLPVILLTDRAEKMVVADAAKSGVQGYMLKTNFSLDTLLDRINTCVGHTDTAAIGASDNASSSTASVSSNIRSTKASPVSPAKTPPRPTLLRRTDGVHAKARRVRSLQDLKPIITKAAFTKLVNDGLKLKPLAETVQNVMAVTGSAGCSGADVAKAVRTDQALCIRLLKLANSSAYSRGLPVDSVQMAVQRIGVREVRKLVMTLGVLEHYAGNQSTGLDIRLFWEHSIACGLIAAAIARECQFKAVDDCFLWGTVHDVGRMILLDHIPDEYCQVCNAADVLGLPLEIVEPRMVLLDHCEILKHALDHWQFPHAFIVPVVNHHESVQRLGRLGPEHAQAAMIVALANRIAHALLLGSSGNEMIYPLDELVESLGVPASVIERICASIPDETRDLKFSMLAHSNADTWPDFADMIRTRLDTTVRALCVSSMPSTDAFTLFLDRVGKHDEAGASNLGVIYLREAGEAESLYAKYEDSETRAGCGILPLIVVCQNRASRPREAPWQARRHAELQAPVPIGIFLKSVQEALAEVVES